MDGFMPHDKNEMRSLCLKHNPEMINFADTLLKNK